MFSLWPGWVIEPVQPKYINYPTQKSLLEHQSSGQMIAMGMSRNEKRSGEGSDKVNPMTKEAIAPEKKSIPLNHVYTQSNQSLV